MTGPSVIYGGRVGVPRSGEKRCPSCNGSGHDPARGYQLMGGCDRCQGTGVVPEDDVRVGDKVPMPPKAKLKVSPAHWVDGPRNSPRGVFTNGRGRTK